VFIACVVAAATTRLFASEASPARAPEARAGVVIVHDPAATEAFQPRPAILQNMVNQGITNLTGKATVSAAWLSLVATQDVVGIKVFSEPGPNSGTRTAVAAAVVQGLLSAGLRPDQIIIWDKYQSDLRLAGFFELRRRYGVRVSGSAESGYDETNFYAMPLLGNLVWGDYEFGKKGEGVG